MRLWGFWRRSSRTEPVAESHEYYEEGLRLIQNERYHEALTSFRLALRQRPEDPEILQQMAVVYTRIAMPEESIRFYRRAIEADSGAAAAHYGLAFLLLHSGDTAGARHHLEAFLSDPPEEDDAAAHIAHARRTLAEMTSGGTTSRPYSDPEDE